MPFRDLILVVIVCTAWAFNFIAAAKSLQHIPPYLFTTLRFIVVLLALLPLLRMPPAGQWPRLIMVALCMGALHFSTNFWALMRSADVSSVAIALQTYIPMSVILAVAFLGEKIGWRSIAAICVAFFGVMLVGFDPLVLKQLDALAICLLSAFLLALGSVLMRGIRGVTPFQFQAWTAVISIPFLVLMSLLMEQDQLTIIRTASWIDWAGVLYSGIAASIIGHGLYFHLIQRHPVTSITPYLLLTPALAVGFGVLIWGDQPGPRLLIGGSLVLLGIFIITVRAKQKSADTGD